MNGFKLDGHTVRVDYSVTKNDGQRNDRPRDNHRNDDFDPRDSYRGRQPGSSSYHNDDRGYGHRGGNRGGRGGDRELEAYIPREDRRRYLDNDNYNNRGQRGGRGPVRSRIGGSNPAVDAATGRRADWMSGSYKGGYIDSNDRNYHANTTFSRADFEQMIEEGKIDHEGNAIDRDGNIIPVEPPNFDKSRDRRGREEDNNMNDDSRFNRTENYDDNRSDQEEDGMKDDANNHSVDDRMMNGVTNGGDNDAGRNRNNSASSEITSRSGGD